jgi:hypothetical protein
MSELKCPIADDRIERSETHRGRTYSGLWCSAGQCFCKDATGDFGPGYFDDLEMIEPHTMCTNFSRYGNYCIKLTDADIEALKQGKIGAILHEDEGVFIKYFGGEVDE